MRITPDLFVVEQYTDVPSSLRVRDEDGRLYLAIYYDDVWHTYHASALSRGIDPRYLLGYNEDFYISMRDAQEQMLIAESDI